MQLLSLLTLLVGWLALFVKANPVPDVTATNWTYQDAYNYAISHGGVEDAVASLIFSHVNSRGVAWTTVYQGDIKLHNGAELVIEPSPRGRAFLQKRATTGGPWTYAQGFPWVADCVSPVYFNWQPLGCQLCYTYWDGGNIMRMYSVKANSDGLPFMGYRDDQSCHGTNPWFHDFIATPGPNGCLASPDGRGWRSFQFSPEQVEIAGTPCPPNGW
jgi:hypothetical protein